MGNSRSRLCLYLFSHFFKMKISKWATFSILQQFFVACHEKLFAFLCTALKANVWEKKIFRKEIHLICLNKFINNIWNENKSQKYKISNRTTRFSLNHLKVYSSIPQVIKTSTILIQLLKQIFQIKKERYRHKHIILNILNILCAFLANPNNVCSAQTD